MLKEYVVIDLEMTGLNVKTDRILELGAARVRDNAVTETFSAVINPKVQLSEKIVQLTGITNEMAEAGKDYDSTIKEFLDFLGDDILAGQNIMFDYSFLKQWAVNHNLSFEKKAVDTLKLARKFLPEEQKKDLASLCVYFGIARKNAHRALDDVLETQKILEQLKLFYGEAEPDAFTPGQLQYRVKKQTPATPQQMKYLQRFCEYHKISMPELKEGVTRGEVSRLTDRLITQYGKIKQEQPTEF